LYRIFKVIEVDLELWQHFLRSDFYYEVNVTFDNFFELQQIFHQRKKKNWEIANWSKKSTFETG